MIIIRLFINLIKNQIKTTYFLNNNIHFFVIWVKIWEFSKKYGTIVKRNPFI